MEKCISFCFLAVVAIMDNSTDLKILIAHESIVKCFFLTDLIVALSFRLEDPLQLVAPFALDIFNIKE